MHEFNLRRAWGTWVYRLCIEHPLYLKFNFLPHMKLTLRKAWCPAVIFACLGIFNLARADGFALEDNELPNVPMHEQILKIPGDAARPVQLIATVYTPNGPGPFPLAVMNHGSDNDIKPELEPRFRFTYAAFYFLSRGYAVVLPMMRGYAGSGGHLVHKGCDYEELGHNNAMDIRAVIDYMSSQPNIDGTRIVVAGASFGGWNTLAFGALNDPRVKGLINFSGGAVTSDCPRVDAALAQAAEHYGAHTTVSSIWFYGDNDKIFAPAAWHSMYESYTTAGGKAELVAYGNFLNDAHILSGYPEGVAVWAPKVDIFLDKVGLPSKLLYPEYLPKPFPPPSNYAALDDVDALPYTNEQGKELYRAFLKREKPRVFVIATSGTVASMGGSFDPISKALNACGGGAKGCRVYAVDDHVVWTRPTPIPAPSHFATLEDVSAVPKMDEAGRRSYQKFLTAGKPRAFVIASDGGWALAALDADPVATALQSCTKVHKGCKLYAVDNEVVWPKIMSK
ncbi:alpha/beta hydrolase family protein [Collimonas fungivorans]|uniref:alpha/beta hydrolase family protein n=1 Tax=Collimonas fungivorans TaxID=158899 RepID=UPI003FA39D73